MDLIYFGSGAFGLPTLKHLAAEHRIKAIVTQPDRPAGRGSALTPTPVGAWAASEAPSIPLLKPQKVNVPDVVAQLRTSKAVFVVIAFGQKLGKALLDGVFAINLHASLLPRWRGAAPINAAVLAGDSVTGNSVITLADRMDAGLVLGQSRREIGPAMTAGELHDLLADDGPALLSDVLHKHAAGTLAPVTQDESLVTAAPKLAKSDGWVDFTETADQCRARVNGLSPWPGVTVQFRGEPLKLLRATAASHPNRPVPPGSILDGSLGLVACGNASALRLLEVQPAGKRAMPWQDFSNGRAVKSEEILQGGTPSC